MKANATFIFKAVTTVYAHALGIGLHVTYRVYQQLLQNSLSKQSSMYLPTHKCKTLIFP